ncbi:hypothetical protein KTD23_22920, partial [Burkholderia multivorans]|nr:hypothetical protein [Burkholderia multivorans]
SNPSATFRPLRPKRDTIGNLQRRLWNLFYFNQTASAIPGVIHLVEKHNGVGERKSQAHREQEAAMMARIRERETAQASLLSR